jgi:hypothetical protein
MANYTYPHDIGLYVDSLTLIAEQEQPMEAVKNVVVKNDMPTDLSITVLGTAVLPVPNSITEQSQHNWNVTSGITEEGEGMVSGMTGMFNSGKKYANRSGIHLAPHYLQTYEGSTPRTFDCEWALIPQNKGESDSISKMIKDFKAWASPQPAENEMFVQQPAFWKLIFTSSLQDMIRFKDMVCTSVTVNYAPGGYSDFFSDGFPKQINLSLSFAERDVVFRDDWLS